MDVNIRLSTPEEHDDADSIRRLAQLAHVQPPAGPVMLAELDGEAVAAVGLADGAAVADPAKADPGILRLLRIRRLETRLVFAIFGG